MFSAEILLLEVALAGYLLATLTCVFAGNLWARRLAWLPLTANLTAMILHTLQQGDLPLYDLLGLDLVIAFLVVALGLRKPLASRVLVGGVLLSAFALLLLARWAAVPPAELPAMLRGFWLKVHVVTTAVGYAMFAVTFVQAVASLSSPAVRPKLWPSFRNLTKIAFLFLSMGLFSGAFWASEVWGAFWSWDPKEALTLATWLCYAASLHLTGSRTRTYVFSLLGFFLLLLTFLLADLVSASHGFLY
jgi:cytochrome c biogenesis factor